MHKHWYIIAVVLLGLIQSAIALETVWLKDVTTTSQTDKRTLSETDLPNELTFHLKRGSKVVTLNLRRNHGINPNADFYFARKLKNGQSALVKSRNLEKKDDDFKVSYACEEAKLGHMLQLFLTVLIRTIPLPTKIDITSYQVDASSFFHPINENYIEIQKGNPRVLRCGGLYNLYFFE
ncbi:hypothetical protein CHS0354_032416 [Potamilus streckersoni]|uniref:Uncharacterized protein n=1 Tax=Potamilus streckersoni TaxID=2493646 RepID=A0AAE0S277_9BIVA|nr:hypothetical protein CHS0354_032416 [Potamilus streckersoni]